MKEDKCLSFVQVISHVLCNGNIVYLRTDFFVLLVSHCFLHVAWKNYDNAFYFSKIISRTLLYLFIWKWVRDSIVLDDVTIRPTSALLSYFVLRMVHVKNYETV